MYFKRIEGKHTEYYATNSSGNFAALARKMDEDDSKSWAVFSGEVDGQPHATGLLLEDAMDHILIHFSQAADQKQVKKAKKK